VPLSGGGAEVAVQGIWVQHQSPGERSEQALASVLTALHALRHALVVICHWGGLLLAFKFGRQISGVARG